MTRVLSLVSGAAFAAALVLSLIAMAQTWSVYQRTPPGTEVEALVLTRDIGPRDPGARFRESIVTLMVSPPGQPPFTVVLPHPPHDLVEIWPGATLGVVLSPDTPTQVAFAPLLPRARQRAMLIALGGMLALGMASAAAARFMRIA
ncbi:MAG: hypothetical protein R3D60_09595 [Paracoccaceae bacterium]